MELQSKQQIALLQEQGDSQRAHEANETKLAVATLQAKFETLQNAMQLFAEERDRLGEQAHERASDAIAAAHGGGWRRSTNRHDVGLTGGGRGARAARRGAAAGARRGARADDGGARATATGARADDPGSGRAGGLGNG